jgi:hypothetical protein
LVAYAQSVRSRLQPRKERSQYHLACGRSPTQNIFTERPNENLRIVRVPVVNLPPRFLWFQKQNVGLLRRLIKDHSLVHVLNPQAGAMPAYLSNRMGVPVVTSVHHVPLYGLKACATAVLETSQIYSLGTQSTKASPRQMLFRQA